ncbi:hypothetical protein SAMN04489712_11111 [Thermomonospora echinospora]|uniref:Uncharacterized protein n=1 Tax=Thermomonospora echinospora TaxID=1992 RepID=A0A1H6CRB4_9ACTN|nr:hypothetical protein [Thermomonospora echinospora]SEG75287.1 hypothetical protein SAMN04489712_11111 [Thermomonospora echinospora]
MSSDYPDAVVAILAESFPRLAEPAAAQAAAEAIRRHTLQPDEAFEYIVDDQEQADWRIHADRRNPGRVMLSCFRYTLTAFDYHREERVNTALAELPL